MLKKLRRQTSPDPDQLSLPLDFADPALLATTPLSDLPNSAERYLSTAQLPLSKHESVPQTVNLTPTSTTLPPGSRRIQLAQHLLDYTLTRSRRRTIGFVIDDHGLRIMASKSVAIAEIERAIRNKQRWILSKLHQRRERIAQRLQLQMEWRDGAALPYLGASITLRLVDDLSSGVEYRAATRELAVCLPANASEQQFKDRVQAWLQTQARTLFAERLPYYAAKLDVQYHAFALSSATTQWGSCNANGKIRLNWRLIHFSPELIDYVIAHELAHLREMNHSPRFWAVVQSVFPEFAAAKKFLHKQSVENMPVF